MIKKITEKVTPKEAVEMIQKGLENYSIERIAAAAPLANAVKNTWADAEKQFKTELEKRLSIGDQLSLDLGPNTFTTSCVELDEISFDCSDADLYTECVKLGMTIYTKNDINKTAIKKDYKNGSLHPDLIKHIKITKQQELKITKKAKKEEEE